MYIFIDSCVQFSIVERFLAKFDSGAEASVGYIYILDYLLNQQEEEKESFPTCSRMTWSAGYFPSVSTSMRFFISR